ncbi:hypothetical protein Hdeb2414_s0010g00346641 [Helianthus debilis subsp. tardiflorus]
MFCEDIGLIHRMMFCEEALMDLEEETKSLTIYWFVVDPFLLRNYLDQAPSWCSLLPVPSQLHMKKINK